MDVEALPDHELLAVLLWLDARALEAAERVCRRWRRLALCPAACRALRPRACVWAALADREAVVAERVAGRGWLAGRFRESGHVESDPGCATFALDGPRLVLCDDARVDVFDARSVDVLWRHNFSGTGHIADAVVDGPRVAAILRVGAPGNGHGCIHVATAGGEVSATEARSDFGPDFMMWRGDRVAYGTCRDNIYTLERLDVASGRVARSLQLGAGEVDDLTDAFGLADGIGVGVATRAGLLLDDGRSARAARFAMQHDPSCHHQRPYVSFRWHAYAHPDGHTLLTVPYYDSPYGASWGEAPVVAELWDARALARARCTIALPDDDGEFLSFGRDAVRTVNGVRVSHFDLHSGAPVGEPWSLGDEGEWVACANEAFAVVGGYNEQNSNRFSYTVYAFDDAPRAGTG